MRAREEPGAASAVGRQRARIHERARAKGERVGEVETPRARLDASEGLPADEIIPIADTVLVRPEAGPADVEA